MKITVQEENAKFLREIIEGLDQAIGACSQFIHVFQDPRWNTIRNMLLTVKEGIMIASTVQVRQTIAV